MHNALVHNSAQSPAFNVTSNGTHLMPLGSGTMMELLCSSLGNTCYSDTGSTGYNSGMSLRSAPGTNFYINDHNSAFQSQHEPSHQPPHLWSPFDQHTGNSYSCNMSDSDLALTLAQVSFTLVSAPSPVTDTFLQGNAPAGNGGTSRCCPKPGVYAPLQGKYQAHWSTQST
jgi:hypothetical protein